MENDLELLDYRCDGMLSDGDEQNFIAKIYHHILDNPVKLLNYGACTAFGGNHNDCVVKLGKEICQDTNDAEICSLVSKAEIVNDAAKSLLKNGL